MGNQHNTHVTNGLNSTVNVVITHSNGLNDKLHVDPGQTRNVPTKHGNVTISVYDPESTDTFPYESKNLPSDYSVYIDKNAEGKPKIRNVKYGTLRQCTDDAANF
jgi:hypothetical protein